VALRLVPILGVIAAPIITFPSIGAADLYLDYTTNQARQEPEETDEVGSQT
jgi:hypothetical protein